MTKTLKEVQDIVQYLEHDSDHLAMRTLAKERHDLVEAFDIPDLPEHMTRGRVVGFNSPMIHWLAESTLADTMAYHTLVTVTPFGHGLQQSADKLEQWATLFRTRANDGGRATRETRWHQMLSPYGVMILHCGDDDEFPWTVETPDPLTCFFPITGGPVRPSIMARRFRMTVRNAIKTYSGRRKFSEDRRLTYMGGKVDWEPVSDDRDGDEIRSGGSGSTSAFEDIEIMAVYEQDYICHVALNKGSSTEGQVVWEGKQLTGGVNAVVIPGSVTPLRTASLRLQPAFWPVMQQIKQINRIRAMRSTTAENMQPDMLVLSDPDKPQSEAQPTLEFEQGGPNLIRMAGNTGVPWPQQPNPDLDKLEQSVWTELDRYINAYSTISDPEVVKDATANAFLTHSEGRRRQQAPMLANGDWGWSELIKMAIHSIGEYDQEFPLYAEADEEYGYGKKVSRGSEITIKKSDIDFKYHLSVTTRSVTESEQRARLQDWAYKKSLGISTYTEGIAAAGYTDEKEQLMRLAEEGAFQENQAWVEQEMRMAVQEEVRLTSRIIIPVASPQAPVGPMTQTPPVGPTPMRPAALESPMGGSTNGAGAPVGAGAY